MRRLILLILLINLNCSQLMAGNDRKLLNCDISQRISVILSRSTNATLNQSKSFKPLPLSVIRNRFERAAELGLSDFSVPELREEARWMWSVYVSRIEPKGIEAVNRPEFGQIVNGLENTTINLKPYFQPFQNRLKEFRNALQKLINSPDFSYWEWERVSSEFVELASLAPTIDNYFNDAGLWLVLRESRSGKSLSEVVSRSFQRFKEPFHSDAWLALPTARRTSIDEMNEWMSHGITPIYSSDEHAPYDFTPLRNGSPLRQREHDIGHFQGLVHYNSNMGVSSRQIYLEFENELISDPAIKNSPLKKQTLEALWFYCHHEMPWTRDDLRKLGPLPHYGPEAISRMRVSDLKEFSERLVNPDDLGGYFSDSLPDMIVLNDSLQWLKKFAKKLSYQSH